MIDKEQVREAVEYKIGELNTLQHERMDIRSTQVQALLDVLVDAFNSPEKFGGWPVGGRPDVPITV